MILMTNQQRYQKYIKEHCKNCKNNKTNLCDIRIAVKNDVIETKCMLYDIVKSYMKNNEKEHWKLNIGKNPIIALEKYF